MQTTFFRVFFWCVLFNIGIMVSSRCFLSKFLILVVIFLSTMTAFSLISSVILIILQI